MNNKLASKVIQAAIEAGAIEHGKLTIVIVVDGAMQLDIASTAPTAAAAGLVRETLILALHELSGHEAVLTQQIEVGKS